jgi:predicted transcriptional regulator
MGTRLELQSLLETILGSRNVYFQPPPTLTMKYPCIVYNLDDMNTIFAGNYPYKVEKRYSLTVIDKDPDSEIPDKIALLQKCVFDRHFVTDNLNHNIFVIYF